MPLDTQQYQAIMQKFKDAQEVAPDANAAAIALALQAHAELLQANLQDINGTLSQIQRMVASMATGR